MIIVNENAVTSFDRAYMACAESHAGGDRDTSERCCIVAGICAAVPFVLAAHIDDAGGDESAFTDWWMSQYERAQGGDAR